MTPEILKIHATSRSRLVAAIQFLQANCGTRPRRAGQVFSANDSSAAKAVIER
jgi:hypothetical protein